MWNINENIIPISKKSKKNKSTLLFALLQIHYTVFNLRMSTHDNHTPSGYERVHKSFTKQIWQIPIQSNFICLKALVFIPSGKWSCVCVCWIDVLEMHTSQSTSNADHHLGKIHRAIALCVWCEMTLFFVWSHLTNMSDTLRRYIYQSAITSRTVWCMQNRNTKKHYNNSNHLKALAVLQFTSSLDKRCASRIFVAAFFYKLLTVDPLKVRRK